MKSQNIIRPTQVFATLALLTFGAGLATGAPQSPAYDQQSTVVGFHDLNLANAKDVAALYLRITRAARWVCRDDDKSLHNVPKMRLWQECVDTTIERAIAEANRPALTALHRAKTTRLAGG